MKNNIHSYYLTLLRRLIKASFVGWVSENNKKYLQFKIDGKTISMVFEGKEITEQDYRKLIENILENGRTREIQEPISLHVEEQGIENVDA